MTKDISLVGSSHKVLATENKLDSVETNPLCLAVYDALLNSLDEKEQQQVSKKIMENWK